MRTNKIIIFLPLFLAMMLGVTGCNSEDSEDVTAIYHVLDKNGHEASVFNYGDEILLALRNGIAKVDPAGPKVISFARCPAGLSNGGVIHDKRFYMVSGSHIRSLNLDKPELFKPVE